MAKVTLATGMIVGYGYMMEAFFGYFSANTYEKFMIWNRMTGPYAAVLLDPDSLQHHHSADPVVQAVRTKSRDSVVYLDRGQHRHVARAFRYRHHQPAPRLPPFVLGYVLSDDLGLGGVHGTLGFFMT